MDIKSDNKDYKCVVCSKSFTRKETHIAHELWHTGQSPHNCIVCKKSYTRDVTLKQHMKKHLDQTQSIVVPSKKPQFLCTRCPKIFTRLQYLNDHVNFVHEEESRHKCQFCDKKLSRKDHLIQHSRSHSGETPYKCERCDETFRTKQMRRTHMDKHCGDEAKTFVCYVCKMPLKTKSSVINHIARSHIMKGDYKCWICSKEFLVEPNLMFHLKSHKI